MDNKKAKKKKRNTSNGIGIGYISEACAAVGVSTTVYYTAKKKLDQKNGLTKAEIEVMLKHKELTDKAKADLETIRSNQS